MYIFVGGKGEEVTMLLLTFWARSGKLAMAAAVAKKEWNS